MDTIFLQQLLDSMSDAIEKLEQVAEQNKIEEFNKLKAFILDIQTKIKLEIR